MWRGDLLMFVTNSSFFGVILLWQCRTCCDDCHAWLLTNIWLYSLLCGLLTSFIFTHLNLLSIWLLSSHHHYTLNAFTNLRESSFILYNSIKQHDSVRDLSIFNPSPPHNLIYCTRHTSHILISKAYRLDIMLVF